MAVFSPFDKLSTHLLQGKHDFSTHSFKAGLITNDPSLIFNVTKWANLTEITPGHGYLAGGVDMTVSVGTDASANDAVSAAKVTITATDGPIGPYTALVVYNDTSTDKNVVGYMKASGQTTIKAGKFVSWSFGLINDAANGVMFVCKPIGNVPKLKTPLDLCGKLLKGNHKIGADTLKVALFNDVLPVLSKKYADVIDLEIAQAFGYTVGGYTHTFLLADGTKSSELVTGFPIGLAVYATGGIIGPVESVALYNDTSATKLLICWWNKPFSVQDGASKVLIFDDFLTVRVNPETWRGE